jgi:hypothetical protein
MFVTISLYDGVKWGTLEHEHEHMDSWNKHGDDCDLRMQIYWFVVINVLGGLRPGSDHRQDMDNPEVE